MKVPVVCSQYNNGKRLVKLYGVAMPWVRKDYKKLKFFNMTRGEFRDWVWKHKVVTLSKYYLTFSPYKNLLLERGFYHADVDDILLYFIYFKWAGLKPVKFKDGCMYSAKWPKSWEKA